MILESNTNEHRPLLGADDAVIFVLSDHSEHESLDNQVLVG